MNRIELKQKLEMLGIPQSLYNLQEISGPNQIVMESYSGGWVVFYTSEHMRVLDRKIFKTEDEACEYLYNEMYEWVEFNKRMEIRAREYKPRVEKERMFIVSENGDAIEESSVDISKEREI